MVLQLVDPLCCCKLILKGVIPSKPPMAPKDKDIITQNSGVIYRCKCNTVDCNDANITGHQTSLDDFTIVGRESPNLIRTFKKAMYIRFNDASLNRNMGKVPSVTHMG